MDAYWLAAIIVLIFVVIIVLYILGRKPKLLCSIPNKNAISFRGKAINKLQQRGYKIGEKKMELYLLKKISSQQKLFCSDKTEQT